MIGADVFATVIAAQTQSASAALAYVPAVLAEQGVDAPAAADVNVDRFAGASPDGRPLETLLDGALYQAKQNVAAGMSTLAALNTAGGFLQQVVLDSTRRAGLDATSAGYTVRPRVQGWVRMLNPPSCKWCIMLAGKFYRWNSGFRRHDRCDCRHIPTQEALAGDLTVDPYKYFHSLDEGTQNRLFGKNDAQALRDGGDIYRVVNIRSRGLADDRLKSGTGHTRGWQARRWGTPSKMTIDDIYAATTDRNEAIKLMRENGFITGDQVAGGNLIGNAGGSLYGDLAAGQLGRGGTRKGATLAYRKAIATGQRDLLEPATQTAAERRLHQAVMLKQSVDAGRNPFGTHKLGPAEKRLVESTYRIEINNLKDPATPASVLELAKLLHVL